MRVDQLGAARGTERGPAERRQAPRRAARRRRETAASARRSVGRRPDDHAARLRSASKSAAVVALEAADRVGEPAQAEHRDGGCVLAGALCRCAHGVCTARLALWVRCAVSTAPLRRGVLIGGPRRPRGRPSGGGRLAPGPRSRPGNTAGAHQLDNGRHAPKVVVRPAGRRSQRSKDADHPDLSPAHARGRGHPRDARDGRRVRAPRASVLRRQGLDRAAAPGREGVPPGAVPVSGDARRHRPQLPGGDRVPRPPRAANWASG